MIGWLVNNEFGRIWKEAVVVYFKVLSRHLAWRDWKNHENPQTGQSVSGPRFELGTYRIKARVLTTTDTFGSKSLPKNVSSITFVADSIFAKNATKYGTYNQMVLLQTNRCMQTSNLTLYL
jgi:hypothetical protein